jgi:hypothetical protein
MERGDLYAPAAPSLVLVQFEELVADVTYTPERRFRASTMRPPRRWGFNEKMQGRLHELHARLEGTLRPFTFLDADTVEEAEEEWPYWELFPFPTNRLWSFDDKVPYLAGLRAVLHTPNENKFGEYRGYVVDPIEPRELLV